MRLIDFAKTFAKRHWPALPLRVILFGTLLFVAGLPGVGAVFLRVYENTLVQQTEAELVAAGAILSAAYKADWPGGASDVAPRPLAYRPPQIDLRTEATLPPLPAAKPGSAPDARASRVAQTLAPIIADAGAVTLSATRLLDARGIVVLGRDDLARSYAAVPEVRAALAGRSVTTIRRRADYRPRYMLESLSRASAIRVHHVRPAIVSGRVVGIVMLSRSPRGLFLGIYQDRGKIALGVGLILATLLLLAALLSRAIARPIDLLTQAMGEVAAGGAPVPQTPATAAIEIRQLYENFRVMADRIERRGRYLRDFAAAVAHEFKTPIAGITGALELLGDHGGSMSPDERARFIGNAQGDADRLSRLIRRLQDLARADMAAPAAHARADVVASCRRAADALRTGILAIEVQPQDLSATARIAPEVLETVLETLLDNSRQADACRIVVGVSASSEQIGITVADDGRGIPDADHARIFDAFFTGRRDTGGTGLGLSIARSLLAASGGTIDLAPTDRGTTMVITLPPAN